MHAYLVSASRCGSWTSTRVAESCVPARAHQSVLAARSQRCAAFAVSDSYHGIAAAMGSSISPAPSFREMPCTSARISFFWTVRSRRKLSRHLGMSEIVLCDHRNSRRFPCQCVQRCWPKRVAALRKRFCPAPAQRVLPPSFRSNSQPRRARHPRLP